MFVFLLDAVTVPAPSTQAVVTNELVKLMADELRRAPPPELGLVGQRLLGAAIAGLCRRDGVKPVLPATCLLTGTVSLTTLRLAVLQDVITLVVNRVVQAGTPALQLVAEAIRGVPVAEARLPDPLAQEILARLLEDAPRFEAGRERYREIVTAIARARLNLEALTPEMLTATDDLVAALHDASSPTRKIHALAAALFLAARLEGNGVLAAAFGPAEATATAILDGFLQANARTVTEIAAAELRLPPAEAHALRIAADLAQARTESDLKRVARDAVLPLPPWVDRFAFDLNLAPPVNKKVNGDSELSLNGDLTVGYNGDRFGFVASGSTAYYDVAANGNSALTERYAGSLDVWALIDLGKYVRLEPRLSGGATYYGTLASDSVAGGNRQTNQDSIFGRGVGSLGVRVEPNARFALGAALGMGAQYEDYFRVLQISTGEQGTTFNSAVTLRYEARLRAQFAVVPEIVSVRARLDFQAFDMNRSDQAVTFTLGRVTQQEQGITEISQRELYARGFIDADVVKFFGFVPSLHGGVNVFSFSKDGVGDMVVVPVVGVGIRRAAL